MNHLKIFFLCLFVSIAIVPDLFARQKVVLFNDTSAWYHWGCTGTSLALKEKIESLGFEITAFPINVTYALQDVPPFDDFHKPEKYEHFCNTNREVVAAIQAADAVVITGEGTIHDLRAGPRALLYLAHVSKSLGKHVEIINHSAYPKDDPSLSEDFLANFGVEKEREISELERAQAIYHAAYADLDFVAIREPMSSEAMQKIGIQSTLSFDCLPLYIRDHYKREKQSQERILLVAGSVAYSNQGVENLCRYLELMASTGMKIKVLIGAAAYPSKDDSEFVDFLRMHLQADWELIQATSMNEWLDTINDASLLVSGRLHHSIASFCLNTPFIALNSNTHKVHAICSVLEQKEPLLFSDPQLLDHLLIRTLEIFSLPRVDNAKKFAEICNLAERNFDGLSRFIPHERLF